RVSACSAQCHATDFDGCGIAVRRAAGGRNRDRNKFFIARKLPPDHPGDPHSRPIPGAGMYFGDRPDLRVGELLDRFVVFRGESENSTIGFANETRQQRGAMRMNLLLVMTLMLSAVFHGCGGGSNNSGNGGGGGVNLTAAPVV